MASAKGRDAIADGWLILHISLGCLGRIRLLLLPRCASHGQDPPKGGTIAGAGLRAQGSAVPATGSEPHEKRIERGPRCGSIFRPPTGTQLDKYDGDLGFSQD